jgi:hypothetical protein
VPSSTCNNFFNNLLLYITQAAQGRSLRVPVFLHTHLYREKTNEHIIKKKVSTIIVNNLTSINKTNNNLSLHSFVRLFECLLVYGSLSTLSPLSLDKNTLFTEKSIRRFITVGILIHDYCYIVCIQLYRAHIVTRRNQARKTCVVLSTD